VAWSLTQPDENEPPVFTAGDDTLSWLDIFTRPSDRLVVTWFGRLKYRKTWWMV
jgi:leader peptidase (prepilin peptidase)/N-methyltransferase